MRPEAAGHFIRAMISAVDLFETFDLLGFGRIERLLASTKPAAQDLQMVSIVILFCDAGYISHPCQDSAEPQRGALYGLVQGV